jgi:2-methylisocitrate lyase-like PEP mutase family enzyme
MSNPERRKKAEALRSLHSAKQVLLLANVWDVASACIIEEGGFPALATSSAAVAFSQGYPDGEKIPPHRMMAVIARIAAAIRVPLTADVEAGYGSQPEDAARTAGEVIEAGAVGMNLEDATGDRAHPLADLSLQLEKIRAVRQASEKAGVPLVLNARTDVYLLQVGEPSQRYDQALRRLAAFRDAGADCVFVPGLSDPPSIGRLVADLKCPVNILAVPGSPAVAQLAALGVQRISLGSGPMRATLGFLRRLATELQTQGTYTNLAGAPPYAEMNALMSAKRNSDCEK